LFLHGVLTVGLGAAFQVTQYNSKYSSPSKLLSAAGDVLVGGSEFVDDGDDDDDLALSPMQVKFLRKEAGKRKARRKLHRLSVPTDESSGPFTEETLSAISGLLDVNELVEVRGISLTSKKKAFQVSEDLAATLSHVMEKDVFVIDRSGFKAIMYCQGEDDLPGKIKLRTSVGQKNVWKAKPKPPRDNRGQIIPDWKDDIES